MDFFNDLIQNQALMGILKVIARIIIIFVLARIITKIGNKAIEHFFRRGEDSAKATSRGRVQTLTKLSQNILHYIVNFIAVITILDMFISITPLLTGAGVLGLAVGFGAQGFVKDVVSGFFILFEGQYDVGDKVQINGVDGIVEELGIRTTIVKGESNERNYISNGSITQVANFSAEVEKRPEA